jgi:thiol:disulfide interchange protein
MANGIRRVFGFIMFLLTVSLISVLPEYLWNVALGPLVGAMIVGLWLVIK